MENQTSSKKIMLNNGVILGIILIVIQLGLYASGILISIKGGIISLLSTILLVIALPIISIYMFKKSNQGFISWTQAVKIGIGVVLLGSLISIIWNHIFTTFIEPDFFQQVNEFQSQMLFEAGVDQDEIDSIIEKSKKSQGTLLADGLTLLAFAAASFFISAIAGAIMKKSEEEAY